MSIPFITKDVARSIYYYAGGYNELPDFDSLPPTVQISYIEEAEAAIKTIAKHIRFLSTQLEEAIPESTYKQVVPAIIQALAETLSPDVRR